jgi:hypothetical protein
MGRPASPWTAERNARLIALRAEGLSWDAVGRKLGVNGSTASEHGRMLGVGKPVSKFGAEQPHHVEAIRRMIECGTPKPRIAADLGISLDRVYDICRREGISRPVALAPRGERSLNSQEIMPPGHPTSWGAITAGTSLEGTPYR